MCRIPRELRRVSVRVTPPRIDLQNFYAPTTPPANDGARLERAASLQRSRRGREPTWSERKAAKSVPLNDLGFVLTIRYAIGTRTGLLDPAQCWTMIVFGFLSAWISAFVVPH